MSTPATTSRLSRLPKLVAYHGRFWLALLVGVVIFLIAPTSWSPLGRLLTAWNVGVLLLLVLILAWATRLNPGQMRERYVDEDPTAGVILLGTVAAALFSLYAIVALLSTIKHVGSVERAAHVALATLTIVDSWLLVPTMFTLHYADYFYSAEAGSPPLLFPETTKPVFWDFAYFSFTIAAACQTADVATANASIRKIVIAHSVISFVFNASILGFAINVSAGLLGGG